ncbi:hypothetical protein FDECE_6666 [Fusarium decemcellulare]|nr:hypothetical protein FDECE_6666 [Fusarium decemcellulare]
MATGDESDGDQNYPVDPWGSRSSVSDYPDFDEVQSYETYPYPHDPKNPPPPLPPHNPRVEDSTDKDSSSEKSESQSVKDDPTYVCEGMDDDESGDDFEDDNSSLEDDDSSLEDDDSSLEDDDSSLEDSTYYDYVDDDSVDKSHISPMIDAALDESTLDHDLEDTRSDDGEEEDGDAEGEEYDENPANDTSGQSPTYGGILDIEDAEANMAKINMDDDQDVERRIRAIGYAEEVETLRITQEQEDKLYEKLPKNQESLNVMKKRPEAKKAVAAHRQRMATVVRRMAQLVLGIGSYEQCPLVMRGWFLFCVANASREARDRLVRIMTHPSAQSLAIQCALGRDTWTAAMFDRLPRINLEDPNSVGDVVTAYLGVAHCGQEGHYLYSGSATSLNLNQHLVGEASRMTEHGAVLAAGADKIKERRNAGDGSNLYVHEKMAQGAPAFFVAAMRLPVDTSEPVSQVAAAVALFAENCHMILLGTCRENHLPRNRSLLPLAQLSRRIAGMLRPNEFPRSPFQGANAMLPMLQIPRAVWKLLTGHITELKRTDELNKTLENHFTTTRQPWLPRDVCSSMLMANNLSTNYIHQQALKQFYAKLLSDHGIEYQTQHELYLTRLGILFVGVIRDLEQRHHVEGPHDDGHYTFSEQEIDWFSVSKVAEDVAPSSFKGKYSPQACKDMYNHKHTDYFKQKVTHRLTWEQLRSGLPSSFSTCRATQHFPPVIRQRIWHICRSKVYTYMRDSRYIQPVQNGIVKLGPDTPRETALLRPSVIKRLELDIKMCGSSVDVATEAYKDKAFVYNIDQELREAFRELKAGVPEKIFEGRIDLQTVGAGWVDPPRRANLVENRHDHDHEASRNDSVSPDPLQQTEQEKDLTLLLESHVLPVPIFTSRTSDRKDRVEAKSSGSSTGTGENNQSPFELLDGSGQAARRPLFILRSGQRTSSEAYAVPTRMPRGAPLAGVEWVNGECPCPLYADAYDSSSGTLKPNQ